MSIDLRTITGKAVDPPAKPSPSRKETRSQAGDSPPASDSVQLTDVAAKLKQAQEALAAGSVIDTDLVARVADALQSGSYKIDAEQIAEKMIEMERQLPGAEGMTLSE